MHFCNANKHDYNDQMFKLIKIFIIKSRKNIEKLQVNKEIGLEKKQNNFCCGYRALQYVIATTKNT